MWESSLRVRGQCQAGPSSRCPQLEPDSHSYPHPRPGPGSSDTDPVMKGQGASVEMPLPCFRPGELESGPPRNSCCQPGLGDTPLGSPLFGRKGTPGPPVFQRALPVFCLAFPASQVCPHWEIANSLHGKCQLPTYENIHIIKS